MVVSWEKGRIAIPAVVIAAMAIACMVTYRSVAGSDSFKPHKLTILFTGDDWGQVKPCG